MQGLGVVSPRSMAAIATEIAAVLLNEDCRNVLSLHSDRTHVIFYILLFAECSNGWHNRSDKTHNENHNRVTFVTFDLLLGANSLFGKIMRHEPCKPRGQKHIQAERNSELPSQN